MGGNFPTYIFETYALTQTVGALGTKSKYIIVLANEEQGGILTLHFWDGTTLNNLSSANVDTSKFAMLDRDSNTFTGEIVVHNGHAPTMELGDYQPLKMQNILGTNYFLYNCFIYQDEDSGEFLFRQINDGYAGYFNLSNNGWELWFTQATANANDVVYPKPILQVGRTGLITEKRDEWTLTGELGDEYLNDFYTNYLILVDASNYPVNFLLDPANEAFKGKVLEILCVNDTNGAAITIQDGTNKISPKSNIANPVPTLGVYKGDSLRLFFNGSIIREL